VRPVFVETNWVVGYAAPEHHQLPDARSLFDRAAAGELRLYLPSVCLTEARTATRRRFQPRREADAIRQFLDWGRRNGRVTAAEDQLVRRIVDQFESRVRAELDGLDATLEALRSCPDAIDVFALDDEMLERSVELGASDLDLNPFDQAVLAAVLVRAKRLRDAGHEELAFCELDGDLQPWDKQGNAKQPLTRLYDEARVWVYGDFELAAPSRPPGWPGR
jgi:predicted nucleic acid-binding protein